MGQTPLELTAVYIVLLILFLLIVISAGEDKPGSRAPFVPSQPPPPPRPKYRVSPQAKILMLQNKQQWEEDQATAAKLAKERSRT